MKLALVALSIGVLEPRDPLDARRPARSPVSLTFAAYASTAEVDVMDVTSAKTRIDAVWIGLQDARLRSVTACKSADGRATVTGSVTMELVKRHATTTETKLEVARYCALDVQLRRTKGRAAHAPSELKGASIVVVGRRSDGVSFTIRSRFENALTLRAADLEGFAIPEAGARWIAGVDIARWLQNIDLLDATTDPRGRVVIDDRSNPELLTRFNANLEHGIALFEDRNGDTNLNAEERAHPIATRH
jgi:hypothetical protein